MKSSFFIACLNTIILFLFFTNISFSQEPKIKWGEIPKSDLEMKSYPADTNANAVILYDYGESNVNDDIKLKFTRHLRVKILNSKGYEWGTHSVELYTGSYVERIENIEGTTYWLDANGQVKSSALSSKDIFMEKVTDKVSRCKFTLPSLKPGCVIEISYDIISSDIFSIKGWAFQYSEPVIWSEYSLFAPINVAFSCVTTGFEPFGTLEEKTSSHLFAGHVGDVFANGIVKCSQNRWYVKNAPAIREEPYMTTVDDYKNKVDVQLLGFVFNGKIKNIMNDWPKIINELLREKEFGGKIEETSKVRKLVGQITANIIVPEEKLQAIYDWITGSIVCTGGNRLHAEQDINDVIDSKKGSDAEITFLLLSMLKCAGINGDPVILSTRDNGRLQTLYPIMTQFDYVLARVKLDSVSYYVDATDPLRPIDLLPNKVLNVKGLVVKKDTVEWVALTSKKKDFCITLANMELKSDGSLNGNIEDFYKDYGALTERRLMRDKTGIEFAKESFDAGKTGIMIDSATIFGKDTVTVPLSLKTQVSLPGYGQCNGNLIYLNPQIINRCSENPFKTQIRKYPIDYAYGISNEAAINITIPDSFEVKEKPVNLNLFACSKELSFIRHISVEGNRIQYHSKLDVKTSIVPPEFYLQVREFYERIVACEQEQIVLSKIKKTSEPIIEQNNKPASISEPASK
jgi:hypothetical protein